MATTDINKCAIVIMQGRYGRLASAGCIVHRGTCKHIPGFVGLRLSLSCRPQINPAYMLDIRAAQDSNSTIQTYYL